MKSNEYLNDVIEQNPDGSNTRIGPILGFKRLDTAAITICGIELAGKIKKHQFKIGKLAGSPTTAPEVLAAVPAP